MAAERHELQAPKKSRRKRKEAFEEVLITGYPGFLGKQVAHRLLSEHPEAKLTLLVEENQHKEAERELRRHAGSDHKRARIWSGDVTKMDLGLSGPEIDYLDTNVTHIFHLAAIQSPRASKNTLYRTNVEGTRNVVDLAKEMHRLKRLVHVSSCYVSGERSGVIMEDELDEGQSFRSAYERSKFRAEKIMRLAMDDLPVTIVRPSIVIGDSATGEIDRFDGVYGMGILMVTSPVAIPLPLPGAANAPLHVVPVDFVTRAMLALAQSPEAAGATFHLVDPNPLSGRKVYELVAQKAGRKIPRVSLSYSFARRLLRMPLIEKYSRAQAQTVDQLNHFVIYNCANTMRLLEGTGIECPRLETYVEKLMKYVSTSLRGRTRRTLPREGLAAPLDL